MKILAIILFFIHSFAPILAPYSAKGKATYYADRLQGKATASGERYDKKLLTAAHPSLPFGTLVEVTNIRNGLTATVRINDRMSGRANKVIDLSRAAALEIDLVREGIGTVLLEEVEVP